MEVGQVAHVVFLHQGARRIDQVAVHFTLVPVREHLAVQDQDFPEVLSSLLGTEKMSRTICAASSFVFTWAYCLTEAFMASSTTAARLFVWGFCGICCRRHDEQHGRAAQPMHDRLVLVLPKVLRQIMRSLPCSAGQPTSFAQHVDTPISPQARARSSAVSQKILGLTLLVCLQPLAFLRQIR